MQERHNSSALAMKLCLSCTNPQICAHNRNFALICFKLSTHGFVSQLIGSGRCSINFKGVVFNSIYTLISCAFSVKLYACDWQWISLITVQHQVPSGKKPLYCLNQCRPRSMSPYRVNVYVNIFHTCFISSGKTNCVFITDTYMNFDMFILL